MRRKSHNGKNGVMQNCTLNFGNRVMLVKINSLCIVVIEHQSSVLAVVPSGCPAPVFFATKNNFFKGDHC